MCTVSYIPNKSGGFILTSNRDEMAGRMTSPPSEKVVGDTSVVYPKDANAGGTWIAAGKNGRVCCLLNGAFEKHEKKDQYSRSRGSLILDCFEFENVEEYLKTVNLDGVEPFTLLVVESGNKLWEFRWDEESKHINLKDVGEAWIWSSSTLYEKEVRELREKIFRSWLEEKASSDLNTLENTLENANEILKFHSSKHGQGLRPENDIIMKRESGIQTVSITQVTYSSSGVAMDYHDMLEEVTSCSNA